MYFQDVFREALEKVWIPKKERGWVFRYVRFCIRTFRSHIILVGNSHLWKKVRAGQERSPYRQSPFQTGPKIIW
jgi:hypothetical protein